MTNIMHLDDENFDKEVLESDLPVIVDFWAGWCMPCKMLAPSFEALSSEYDGRLKFAKVDVDSARNTAGSNEIRSIPCLILFKDGKEVTRFIGMMSKEAMKTKLDRELGNMS